MDEPFLSIPFSNITLLHSVESSKVPEFLIAVREEAGALILPFDEFDNFSKLFNLLRLSTAVPSTFDFKLFCD